MDCDSTIERLRSRIKIFPPVSCPTNLTAKPPAPLSLEIYTSFEAECGLVLPSFLRRIYTEVANGGFGPAYGINSLMGDETESIATWDRLFQNANHDEPTGPQWPQYLIRFCEIGCNMFYAIDIREESSPVYEVEISSSNDVRDWLRVASPSVVQWLDQWTREPMHRTYGNRDG